MTECISHILTYHYILTLRPYDVSVLLQLEMTDILSLSLSMWYDTTVFKNVTMSVKLNSFEFAQFPFGVVSLLSIDVQDDENDSLKHAVYIQPLV